MMRLLQKFLKKELLFVIVVYSLSLSFFGVEATNKTIEVGKSFYFSKIDEAIKNANDGDIIMVHEGIYEENLVINKRISLIAIGKVTLIGAKAEEPVVKIATNGVQIEGFNITTNGFFSIAIYIAKGYGLGRIYNNTLTNAYFGIYSDETFGNEIVSNSIIKNTFGIMLNYTSETEIKQNKIENNKYGVVLSGDRKNTIQENNIISNQYGIYLFNSQSDYVFNNYLFNNFYGIYLTSFSSNVIVKNNIAINSQYSIFVDTSHFNEVSRNEVESSTYGVYLQNCRHNNILSNFIRNETIGLQLYSTINNTVLNNTVTECMIGIEIDNAYNDTIKENTFSNILAHAITTYKTTGAKILENIVNFAKNGIVLDSSSSNTITENKLNNTYIGVYIYNSDFNSIENIAIKEAKEWYIRSQSEHYNYVENLMFDSEKLNFSFSGKVAIKSTTVNNFPKGYIYLNECIFVNITQGAFAYINFSYANKPYEKIAILYTTDGSNWEKPDTISFFENIKVVTVKAKSSGTYALFSYLEEKPEGTLTLVVPFLLIFALLVLTSFFIRKRKNEK